MILNKKISSYSSFFSQPSFLQTKQFYENPQISEKYYFGASEYTVCPGQYLKVRIYQEKQKSDDKQGFSIHCKKLSATQMHFRQQRQIKLRDKFHEVSIQILRGENKQIEFEIYLVTQGSSNNKNNNPLESRFCHQGALARVIILPGRAKGQQIKQISEEYEEEQKTLINSTPSIRNNRFPSNRIFSQNISLPFNSSTLNVEDFVNQPVSEIRNNDSLQQDLLNHYFPSEFEQPMNIQSDENIQQQFPTVENNDKFNIRIIQSIVQFQLDKPCLIHVERDKALWNTDMKVSLKLCQVDQKEVGYKYSKAKELIHYQETHYNLMFLRFQTNKIVDLKKEFQINLPLSMFDIELKMKIMITSSSFIGNQKQFQRHNIQTTNKQCIIVLHSDKNFTKVIKSVKQTALETMNWWNRKYFDKIDDVFKIQVIRNPLQYMDEQEKNWRKRFCCFCAGCPKCFYISIAGCKNVKCALLFTNVLLCGNYYLIFYFATLLLQKTPNQYFYMPSMFLLFIMTIGGAGILELFATYTGFNTTIKNDIIKNQLSSPHRHGHIELKQIDVFVNKPLFSNFIHFSVGFLSLILILIIIQARSQIPINDNPTSFIQVFQSLIPISAGFLLAFIVLMIFYCNRHRKRQSIYGKTKIIENVKRQIHQFSSDSFVNSMKGQRRCREAPVFMIVFLFIIGIASLVARLVMI